MESLGSLEQPDTPEPYGKTQVALQMVWCGDVFAEAEEDQTQRSGVSQLAQGRGYCWRDTVASDFGWLSSQPP